MKRFEEKSLASMDEGEEARMKREGEKTMDGRIYQVTLFVIIRRVSGKGREKGRKGNISSVEGGERVRRITNGRKECLFDGVARKGVCEKVTDYGMKKKDGRKRLQW